LFQFIETGGKLTYWRQGRSLPYGEAVSYWALAEMVKAQAGILETDSEEESEAKLSRAVEQLVDEDGEWVLSHLRPLVGQTGDATAGSQEEAFTAWRRFFEGLAEDHPLVLVFEDIQWADDGLLDFIEHLVDWVRDVPMLILCTARLELLERRPAWGGGKVNAATIALAPLSDDETATLISALSERTLLEAETQRMLLERAGGNPLYAEQYVRMLDERGSAEQLPESVQGIIAARLDSLPAEEKALLQDAAVVGKVFWLGALGATEQQLHALQQKEFVQRARRSSVEGETEYAFKHLLVRDVAYGQVPRAERAQKHVRTAGWIQSLGRSEDHAETLAHHYAQALELARAAGQDVEALAPRARVAFRDAGARAAMLHALPAADRYYANALELTAADDPERSDLLFRVGQIRWFRFEAGRDELEAARDGFLASGEHARAAEAELFLAQVAWREGVRDRMQEHMDRARSFVAGTAPSRIQAAVLTEASRYEMLANHTDAAVELGRKALRMAEQLGLDDLRAQALNNIGSARGNSGDPGGLAEVEESIEVARRINLISEVLRGLNNAAAQDAISADPEGREARLHELRELAKRYGYLGFLRFLDGGPGIEISYHRGDWEEALLAANAFLADVEAGSPHYQAGNAYSLRALIRIARDDEAGALSDTGHAVELGPRVGDPQALISVLAHCGIVYDRTGDERRAADVLEVALNALQQVPHMGFAVVKSQELAWLSRRFGRERELRSILARQSTMNSGWLRAAEAVLAGDLRGAADVLADIRDRPGEAFCRLRAAEQFVAEGRRAEADKQLAVALAFYRGVGATRYVREVEALLAASA
jgi:hypothetical protein